MLKNDEVLLVTILTLLDHALGIWLPDAAAAAAGGSTQQPGISIIAAPVILLPLQSYCNR